MLSTIVPLAVPDYQRDYSWKTPQLEDFWRDLTDFEKAHPGNSVTQEEYFLGSIVLVDTGTAYEVLDGQQRLATVTMLLCLIRDYLLAGGNQAAAARTESKWIVEFDDSTGVTVLKLHLNRFDRDFFRQLVQQPTSPPPTPTLASHHLIKKAKTFLERNLLEAASTRGGEAGSTWVLRLRNILTDHLSVIEVVSTDEDAAASVFETLNYRGIGLSTPDLLRNFVLRRAKEADRLEVIDSWRVVLEIEDTKAEEFLRHYWLSLEGDVKSTGLYREIKQTLTQRQVDMLTFANDLKREALIYESLVGAKDSDPRMKRLLEDIRDLGAKSLYPVLLSLFVKVDHADKRFDLARDLLKLYVRYIVVGQLEGTRLEKRLYETAKSLRANGDADEARKGIRSFGPTEDEFMQSFRTVHLDSQKQARFLLREIEYYKRKVGEIKVEAPDRVHVEHIYPQTPLPGNKLPDHDDWLNRLGNLTLLAGRLNLQVRNGSFTDKKPHYDKSDLLITKELAGLPDWGIAAITQRQEGLAVIATKIWGWS